MYSNDEEHNILFVVSGGDGRGGAHKATFSTTLDTLPSSFPKTSP